MGAAKILKPISLEDYLRDEAASSIRHEYIRGFVRAMAGSSERHNRLAGRIYAQFLQAENGNCRSFISDMRLQLQDVYYYPDVMVVCAPDPNPHEKTQPCVLVEVLSPSTRNTDLLEKKLAYTGIPTLEAYLLFDADKARVIGYYRTPHGFEERRWSGSGRVEVPCLETFLEIENLYQNL